MLPNRDSPYLKGLAHELSDLPAESEWVEFKRDNAAPETIGRNVSALANGAALNGKPSAYIVWGIEDRTRAIVGTDFPRLGRKAMRVVQYEGTGRFNSLRDQTSEVGYAVGLDRIVEYIMTLVPSRNVIEGAIRRAVTKFPEIAVRELVANALIHQDFTVTGAGPLVAIFDDRIEITNPGAPLVDTNRFVDAPPKSRNEALSARMRRFGFCEEEGTGIDKVVAEVEKAQLPAPLFEEAPGDFTRVILYAHKPLAEMDRSERVRACYHHASLRRVNNRPVNNASIRERFGISRKNSFQASRLLREAVEAGVIVVRNPDAGRRIRSYLPYWAV